jgi:hypothetical protein
MRQSEVEINVGCRSIEIQSRGGAECVQIMLFVPEDFKLLCPRHQRKSKFIPILLDTQIPAVTAHLLYFGIGIRQRNGMPGGDTAADLQV